MPFSLHAPRFEHGQPIPLEFTCEGEDISPELQWRDVPDDTVSLALIVEDPDAPDPAAPTRIFTHWIVYNLSPDALGLPANVEFAALAEGTQVGINDFGRQDYGGPCPPIGRHRYYFRLFALDTQLQLQRPTRSDLLSAMEGHTLAVCELMGTYQKIA